MVAGSNMTGECSQQGQEECTVRQVTLLTVLSRPLVSDALTPADFLPSHCSSAPLLLVLLRTPLLRVYRRV